MMKKCSARTINKLFPIVLRDSREVAVIIYKDMTAEHFFSFLFNEKTNQT